MASPAAALQKSSDAAAGKTYILFEGSIFESVLINRLDGAFSGPVECLLANDIYSHDRQHLLIPAGTKILGETEKVEAFGQSRLAVAFHRLIMPDGYSVRRTRVFTDDARRYICMTVVRRRKKKSRPPSVTN